MSITNTGRATRPGQIVRDLKFYSVEPQWRGETAYVVGGGPSFNAIDPERLRGRRVIALNRSFEKLPFADFALFADPRIWHRKEYREGLLALQGRVIGLYPCGTYDQVLLMHRRKPPGLSAQRDMLTVNGTVMTAGINLAVLLGANPIVLLGADGKRAEDGRTQHYATRYPWKADPKCWSRHARDLETLVQPLSALGIAVLNASPGSAWTMFPVIDPNSVLPSIAGVS